MKQCSKCGNIFSETEFPTVNKRTGKKSSMCLPCKREYDNGYYQKHRKKLNVKKQVSQRAIRIRNRKYIIEYLKNNECCDCGEKDYVVLEFDHQRDKKHNISNMALYSIENIQKEIDKCDVVCANCHRRRTMKQRGYYSYIN